MEHWERLKPGGYRFVYDDELFPPGTDTFALSSLPKLRPGLRTVDLGCGTGLLGLLLMQRQPGLRVTGVDIQPQAIRLAERAAEENGLGGQMAFYAADLREVNTLLEDAKKAAHSLGVGTDIDPFMTLSFMSLPVIPTLRLTTRGVVDVNTQQYV